MQSYRIICAFTFFSILSPGCGDVHDLEVEALSSIPAPDGELARRASSLADPTALSKEGANPLSTCRSCDNCVFHARCLTGDKLPYGLSSWTAKKAIATSTGPRAGCVAVMDTRVRPTDPGHVAYVTSVSADGATITVDEANIPDSVCRTWSGSPVTRKVVGYWCP